MTVDGIFKHTKIENISEERLAELQRLTRRNVFKNAEAAIDFGIEWQEVTGKLLMSDPRTREKGLEKMRDAQRRREEKEILRMKGVFRK